MVKQNEKTKTQNIITRKKNVQYMRHDVSKVFFKKNIFKFIFRIFLIFY